MVYVKRSQYRNHLARCGRCPKHTIGCTFSGTVEQRRAHQLTCGFESIICNHCPRQHPILRKDEESHLREARGAHINPSLARSRIVGCTSVYRGCTWRGPHSSLAEHRRNCSFRLRRCLYWKFGCRVEGDEATLKRHYSREKDFHLSLAATSDERVNYHIFSIYKN